jgi:hypothetical protein
MTYTEDREVFERDLFKPPYLARMLEASGRYVGRLMPEDRAALLASALDLLWDYRDDIHTSNDVTAQWDRALRNAARLRPKWLVWWNWYERRWVRGVRLGRE